MYAQRIARTLLGSSVNCMKTFITSEMLGGIALSRSLAMGAAACPAIFRNTYGRYSSAVRCRLKALSSTGAPEVWICSGWDRTLGGWVQSVEARAVRAAAV
jgi:hypothetical protein